MKVSIYLILCLLCFHQCKQKQSYTSIEAIHDEVLQAKLFSDITTVLPKTIIKNSAEEDSLALLLLPIESICHSCRNKIIDSIVANQDHMDKNHVLIISANGGRKTMEAFFKARGHQIPRITNIFLDSLNQAFKVGLYSNKPVIFYCVKEKVYRKVSSIPRTVKEDLNNFFHGH